MAFEAAPQEHERLGSRDGTMSQPRLLDAIERSRRMAGFYQARDERKGEALRVLKGQLIKQHQAQLYKSNQDGFSDLRRLVYECFRDCAFPTWNPDFSPHGLYWKEAHALFKIHSFGGLVDERTYSRRLNELADERVTNPPLLSWTRPGYYILAQLGSE
jgi:hypothetical protein